MAIGMICLTFTFIIISRSLYFRGLKADREKRENKVTAKKNLFTVNAPLHSHVRTFKAIHFHMHISWHAFNIDKMRERDKFTGN